MMSYFSYEFMFIIALYYIVVRFVFFYFSRMLGN